MGGTSLKFRVGSERASEGGECERLRLDSSMNLLVISGRFDLIEETL